LDEKWSSAVDRKIWQSVYGHRFGTASVINLPEMDCDI